MANPFVTLRNKFVSDLEEIVQCPVCCETLSKTVPSCIQGHHVCLKCQQQMDHCPYCKAGFNGTRNYLAENLLSKFDDIKSSLMNSKHNSSNMVCTETQTDFTGLDNELTGCTQLIRTDVHENVQRNSVAAGKGKFPCKFEHCNEELAHGRMLPHVRYYHKEKLIEEKSMDIGKYTLEWEHSVAIENYERVISIPSMGLFFLHVCIDDAGNLIGNCQIINNDVIAKQFNYSLSLNNHNTTISFKGPIMSCRKSLQKLKNKSLYVNGLCIQQLMGANQTVNCTLLLQRIFDDSVAKNKK